MPPRIPRQALSCATCLPATRTTLSAPLLNHLRTIATTAPQNAVVSSPSPPRGGGKSDFLPATQPPSARRPDTRQAQLIRTYTSLLRSTPLMLFFQHNNLTAVEWIAVRRELRRALEAVGPSSVTAGAETHTLDLAPHIGLQVLRVKMFSVALKITELFDAQAAARDPATQRTDRHGALVHDLSAAAYNTLKASQPPETSVYSQLEPLMSGPLAALVFPGIAPAHLAAALSVLAPSKEFPAPTRKKNPGLYDPVVQNGLAKLLLVGGRVEGSVFDVDGVRWVGGIQGGMDGLRAQLVGVLQGAGLGITNTLDSAGRNLWVTLEGRKGQLEEEQGEKKE